MPADSFLTTHVYSATALSGEVLTTPIVGARYKHFYHLMPTQVAGYFKTNLHLEALPHDYAATVYNIRPNKSVFVIRRHLEKGDMVFASRNGRPVLLWRCGNPLTSSLPTAVKVASETKPSRMVTKVAPTPTLTPAVVAQTSTVSNVITPTELVSPYVATISPDIAPTFGGSTDIFVPAIYSSGSSSFWSALAGLPALGLFGHGGGGTTAALLPVTPTNPGAPAPEMGALSMWLVAAGALGLPLLLARRRSHKNM
jgi:hypothetical protein